MLFSIKFVLCAFCVNFVAGEEFYRAAVVNSLGSFPSYTSWILEAGAKNADILVLPAAKDSGHGRFEEVENYDEITKTISMAAKEAGLYVVAHLHEKLQCQDADEVVRSNLVFDRQGSIVAVYRKPVNNEANCTISTDAPSFSTDFGVSFGLLMEEDLVLKRSEEFQLKNFIVAGGVEAEIMTLRGPQMACSWSFITNANLITPSGVYAGRAGLKTSPGQVSVEQLKKEYSTLMTTPASTTSFPTEDLSQYIIRPLDVEASIRGYTETVCHSKFCCEFYVKTNSGGSNKKVSYGLAAFEGVLQYTDINHIGVQICSIVACAGLYKSSCSLGPNNSTDTIFERIQISGNFAENSAQYPVIISTSGSQNVEFEQENYENTNKVTIRISQAKDILNFGIFGRVYSKDYKNENVCLSTDRFSENYYDYFFNEYVMEFFDYVWIRLKIVMFIVSIYVLEQM